MLELKSQPAQGVQDDIDGSGWGLLRGRRVFMSSNTRRSKYRQIRKTQEGRVEENMGGIIVIRKRGQRVGGAPSNARHYGDLVEK